MVLFWLNIVYYLKTILALMESWLAHLSYVSLLGMWIKSFGTMNFQVSLKFVIWQIHA